ncbi:hypothetical protein A2V82_08735 [candidate division KSB1 bacterium RBG_16_48_16]|nr:MAG: hypothetical protein A2V82_08735 [candidate division KSB1 bacterium RBG_16_48_16]
MELLVLLVVFSLVPAMTYAGVTGKIIGKVTDKETGEALPGANVVIEGSSLGAATTVQGGFIILNVPPGTMSIKASFIGYRDVVFNEVLVHPDLTTEVNFELPTEAIEVESIAITATRPLINKNTTNTTRIKTAEEIEALPVRGFRSIMSLESGVTSVGGRIYVRGGRREEIATYIDGVYQNNPTTGRASGDISNNAIQEVVFQAGGFNAEYGFANSGVVQTITKSGGAKYSLSGEVITDEFLSKSDKTLGTYSYGYNVYNLSLGGPIPSLMDGKIKFYLGAERRFLQDANPSNFAYQKLLLDENGNPLDAQGNPITTAVNDSTGKFVKWDTENAFPGKDGAYKSYQWDEQGIWPDKSSLQWLWNGNITFDFNPIVVRIGGNSQRDNQRLLAGFAPGADYQNTTDGAGVGFSLWNSVNNPKQVSWRDSYHLKVTHTLGSNTFYTAQVNYFRDKFTRSSVMFGDSFWNVGDAVDIGPLGTEGDGITNPYITQNGSKPILDQRSANLFAAFGTQPGLYWKEDWQFWGVKADLTHQAGTTHEIKAGLEYRYNTYKNYAIGGYGAADLHSLAQSLAQVGPDLTAEQAYQVRFVDNFGYDVFGNESGNLGRNDAKNPVIAAFYLQDKIELEDLVMNFGLRYDYFDPAYDGIADVEHVKYELTDQRVYDLKEENFVKNDPWTTISPRLGFSFPVTDRTVFHAQYGKFVQTPELNRLYTSTLNYAWSLQSGNFFTMRNPNLDPVRTTAYEVGFRQQLGTNSALDITAYYKEIRDHIRLVNLDFATPVPYAIYQNQDYGTVKGLALSYTLRRTSRISANLNYTLQWAAGTGSDANTFFNIAWQQGIFPTYVAPLDFDQRHVGTVNIDLRTTKDDVVPEVGLNVLFTFGSGLAFTPVRKQTEVLGGTSGYFPIGQVGSSYGPWVTQMDLKLDKTLTMAGIRFNAYVWAVNVLDFLNANWVYPGTGEPDNDGYFDTEAGQTFLRTWGENGRELYNFLLRNPNMVGPPRQIRLGLRFDM